MVALLRKKKKNYAQNSFPLNEKEGNTMCNISLEENSKNFALEKSCLIVYTAVQIWERPELEAISDTVETVIEVNETAVSVMCVV